MTAAEAVHDTVGRIAGLNAVTCAECGGPCWVCVKGPTPDGAERDFVLLSARLSPRSRLAAGEAAWTLHGRDRVGELVAVRAGAAERLVLREHWNACPAWLTVLRSQDFGALPALGRLVAAGWAAPDVAARVGVPWMSLRAQALGHAPVAPGVEEALDGLLAEAEAGGDGEVVQEQEVLPEGPAAEVGFGATKEGHEMADDEATCA